MWLVSRAAMSTPQAAGTKRLPQGRGVLIAMRLRALTGVREELLDRVRSERTRYTALAAVMVCTASIGGFSMFLALGEVLGNDKVWLVLIAVFWAIFILCIDCWLVSSTAGSRWRTRISVLLPRLAIATVFGIVIAEPLVLRVFQTGIVNHVKDERQASIDQVRTSLVACNPVPGVSVSRSIPQVGCAGMTLNISGPASTSLTRVQALQQQKSSLQVQVNSETAQLHQLEITVNDECNGNRGSGLTGIYGNGPACKKDQQYVTNYESTHPIGAQNTQLANLESQIKSQQGILSGRQANYQSEVSQAIDNRLKEETSPSAPIGMAERFQALAFLSMSNSFIAVASWFIRIFFILIDCLPVLVKFLSGSSPYDRLVEDEIISAEKQFKSECEVRDAIVDTKNGVTLKNAKAEAARKIKEINLDTLRHGAERDSLKENEVDELWRRKLDARRSADAAAKRFSSGSRWSNGSSGFDDDPPGANGSPRRFDSASDGASDSG